jgi:pyrroloquinoline quinone (PQQ) biosynthesis protein C
VTVALESGAVSLLERCATQMEGGGLSEAELRRLESWCSRACERSRSTEDFLSAAPAEWESLILAHPAHHHAWYGFIKEEITTDELAQFLLENRHYPTFLRLLEAIEAVQICEDGRRAVQENIADEQEPVPHAGLMRRLMEAVRHRARPDLELAVYPTLVDRTLVFYYGYYCDAWHLVGSVFATERMATRRVSCMDEGLRRLGFDEHARAFTITHSECDDHHARDWLERVIVPGIERDETLRAPIAKGIAACLDTSEQYLDSLMNRVIVARAAAGRAPGR